jgi:hypothetical protein
MAPQLEGGFIVFDDKVPKCFGGLLAYGSCKELN